jgi:hypothetical protein
MTIEEYGSVGHEKNRVFNEPNNVHQDIYGSFDCPLSFLPGSPTKANHWNPDLHNRWKYDKESGEYKFLLSFSPLKLITFRDIQCSIEKRPHWNGLADCIGYLGLVNIHDEYHMIKVVQKILRRLAEESGIITVTEKYLQFEEKALNGKSQ